MMMVNIGEVENNHHTLLEIWHGASETGEGLDGHFALADMVDLFVCHRIPHAV